MKADTLKGISQKEHIINEERREEQDQTSKSVIQRPFTMVKNTQTEVVQDTITTTWQFKEILEIIIREGRSHRRQKKR